MARTSLRQRRIDAVTDILMRPPYIKYRRGEFGYHVEQVPSDVIGPAELTCVDTRWRSGLLDEGLAKFVLATKMAEAITDALAVVK